MNFLKSNPSFSFLLYSFILFSFFTLSISGGLNALHISGDSGGVFELSNDERFLAEQGTGGSENSSLILAEERTHREDPLDDFKPYTGGWDIKNQHYWASVALTGAPFFIVAAVWFVLFGICLFIICLCCCCCRKEPYGYSRIAYALSLVLLILFTISAIAGCIVLYVGQGKFHSRTSSTLNFVVDRADVTAENLRNVSDHLAAAKRIGVNSVFLSVDVQRGIDDIDTKVSYAASTLSDTTAENSDKIQKGLDDMRLTLIILSAVMIFLAFIGLLCSISGLQCVVYTLVILGWILIAITFVLCGGFLLLHNVVGDTCVAMDDWVQNHTAHTTLDDILPCVDSATAQQTLLESKNVTFQLVNLVNGVITTLSNANPPPNAIPPLNYNQSGPPVPVLCSPFHSNLTDRTCSSGEVELSSASEVWKSFTCQVSASGICTTRGRLTPTFYNQMTAASSVSYGLSRYGPFLVDLEDCTFVRQAFTNIINNHCPGLRQYTRWIYIGLVIASSAVMLSLIFWVIYARERRHRSYTKQFIPLAAEAQDKRT